MADVLIDLDDAEPPAPAALDRPPWTRPSASQIRVALAVATVLLVAFTSAAAAAPTPPRFPAPIHIPAAMSEDFLLFDDGVLVRGGTGSDVRSYGLDGRLRWAVPTPVAHGDPIAVASDVLVVPTVGNPRRTMALDRRTGAKRWETAGDLFGVTDDLAVLSLTGYSLADDEVQRMSGVDVHTGRERWQTGLRLGEGQRLMTVIDGVGPYSGWRHAGLGRASSDGRGEFLDFATGAWRAVTGLPSPPPSRDSWYEYGVEVGDHLVVLSSDRLAGGQLRVYGPGSAAPLWATWTDHGGGSICGPWLCVQHGDTTRMLDVRTGAEVRQVQWPLIMNGSSERLIGYTPGTGGELVTEVAVLDAATGRVIRVYSGWSSQLRQFSGWLPMYRWRRGLTWQLVSLRLDDAVAYPLGTFEPSGEPDRACSSTRTHIVCAVRSGGLLLWRYAPSGSGGVRSSS
jgi:hypothetical protein